MRSDELRAAPARTARECRLLTNQSPDPATLVRFPPNGPARSALRCPPLRLRAASLRQAPRCAPAPPLRTSARGPSRPGQPRGSPRAAAPLRLRLLHRYACAGAAARPTAHPPATSSAPPHHSHRAAAAHRHPDHHRHPTAGDATRTTANPATATTASRTARAPPRPARPPPRPRHRPAGSPATPSLAVPCRGQSAAPDYRPRAPARPPPARGNGAWGRGPIKAALRVAAARGPAISIRYGSSPNGRAAPSAAPTGSAAATATRPGQPPRAPARRGLPPRAENPARCAYGAGVCAGTPRTPARFAFSRRYALAGHHSGSPARLRVVRCACGAGVTGCARPIFLSSA